jgi:hypothetical protein
MKRNLRVFAALAISLVSSALTPSLKGSELDKRTVITISQPVAVQGTVLPAGQYVLKLQNSETSRDIIFIFNADETRLITIVQAIHALRVQVPDKSEFSFYESHAGQPAALRTWFYPGDNSGFEFRRPKDTIATEAGAAGGS